MSILDAARDQVVRAINHATVSAYWHIGREIVEALQQGGERATYGKALIERLAQQLTRGYGKGPIQGQFPTQRVGNCSFRSTRV